jgi:hypothetical protein
MNQLLDTPTRRRAAIIWPAALALMVIFWGLALALALASRCETVSAAPFPEAAVTITPQPAQPAPVGDTLDVSGTWKFKGDWLESGLGEGWQKPEYDDSAWQHLRVPGSWEEQGIITPNPRWPSFDADCGYNGYAWYRKHLAVPADWAGVPLTIEFGAIDDYDWVYLNGQLVGSTTTGEESWLQRREYSVPVGVVKAGADNVIAVRVLDKMGDGGITQGPVTLSKITPEEALVEQPGGYTNITQAVVRIGGSVTIPANQRVHGDVVVVGGSADISGYVTGSVVAVGGSVWARPGSWIDRDAVAVGGAVEKAEGAHIGGQTVTAVPGIGWNLDWLRVLPGRLRGPGSFFGGLLVWGFIAALSVLLFRDRLEVMAAALPLHPGRAVGYGLLGFALAPAVLLAALVAELLVIAVLAITVIGILAIPAVAVAMVALVLAPGAVLLIGMAGVFLSLGRAVVAQLGRPDTDAVWAALIGVLVVSLAGLFPWVGALVWLTVVIFGFGLALMTGVGAGERWSYRGVRLRGRRGRAEQPPTAPPAGLAEAPPPGSPQQASPPEAAEPPEQQALSGPEG